MGEILLSLITVTLFCVSAHFFIRSLTAKTPVFLVVNSYSKRALRIERGYRVFAWACLTLFLFYSMALSFWATYSEVLSGSLLQ